MAAPFSFADTLPMKIAGRRMRGVKQENGTNADCSQAAGAKFIVEIP